MAVAEAFLDALGSDSDTSLEMARHLRGCGALEIVREAPSAGSTGKIQHLVGATGG
jgi:hypothetical protein